MKSLKSIFLNLVYVIWWISVWSIFDNLINEYINDNQRLLVYFGVALISLYILQINNVSLK